MPLGPLEDARVWNSLDPVLKEKVRKGEMSIEEAASYVVPIGDLEQKRAREAGPNSLTARPEAQIDTSVQQQVGLDGQPKGEYGPGTMIDVATTRPVQTFDAIGATVDSMSMARGDEIEAARETGIFETLTNKLGQRGLELARQRASSGGRPGLSLSNIETVVGALPDVVDTGLLEAQAAMSTTEDIRTRQEVARKKLDENIAQLGATSEYLKSLPQNPYTADFIQGFEDGDWGKVAWNALPALGTVLGEQAPDMAVSAAVVATTAFATKNPTATATAARIAAAGGSSMEYGSDLAALWDEIPENERTYEKFKEVQERARQVTASRSLVEAALPGIGAKLGTTSMQRVTSELAAQMAAGGLGEDISSRVASGTGNTLAERLASGQGASTGEIALEMLADSAGVATEAGPTLLNAAARDRAYVAAGIRADEVKRQYNQDFARSIQELEDGQVIADANREAFDAEIEADRAIESYKLQNATQTEMPFGSDMAADPQANDRVPTIVDMFSGESKAAPAVQAELASRVPTDQMPEETDEAFEIRKQRETDARNQIDVRKQDEFETTKQKEADRRRLLAEDQTVLKQEKQLQSTADITREATRRLEFEQNQIRSNPENRKGVKNARLGETLEAYARKRKPELIAEVREERLKRIVEARDRTIAEENRAVALEDIETENDFGRMQDERRAAEAKANAPAPTDLFDNVPQQELLPPTQQPTKPAFTGTLTEKQAQLELAAGQLNRQKLTEKIAPARKAEAAKLDAAQKNELTQSIEAEIPTVEAALKKQLDKKASLTAKTYAKSEKEARDAIIEDELTKNPNRPAPEIVKAVAERVATWRKANPRPSNVPAPVNDDQLVQKAKEVAKAKETAQKIKDTKDTKAELKREIDKGATPEQAAEIVRNRKLTPAEDAKLRSELGSKAPTPEPSVVESVVDVDGVKYAITESTELKAVLESIHRSRSRTKLADLLDAVADSDDALRSQQWLAKRLSALVKNLGIDLVEQTPIGVKPHWAGAFSPQGNVVWIKHPTAETILHESLHAVTSNLLTSPMAARNPVVKNAIEMLENARQVAIDALEDDPEMVQKLFPEAFKRAGSSVGPLGNIRELVSYGLTNRSVQSWMGSIKVPGEPFTLWQTFKAAIRSIFSPKSPEQRTLLDDIMEATNDLLELQEVTPGLNAIATADIRQRSGYGFTPASPDAMEDSAEAEFSNPVTKRSMTQIGKGKYNVTIKPEWTESFGSFVGTLIDSLTAGGGRSAATTEIFERAQSSTAAMIRRAEQLFAKIDYNLERQAIDSKVDMKGLRDEYTTDVKAFEKATGKLEKLKLAADMKKKYGDAARAYFQMRRTMDNLSRDILRQRLDDPRPFTEAEAKIYRSIKDNIGSYYTRVYAANTKGVGEERARKMWNEYTKMAKGDMNVEYKDGYDIVRRAAEFVRDNLLTIPSQEKLEGMSLLKLQKLADAWGVEILTGAELDSPLQAAARKEQLITALLEYADITPEAKEMRAIQLVEDTLFAREKAVITDYYRGSKQDRTIVTEREAVPEPIRKLMGEYEDMPLRAMITIARQAEFRARNKAFSELIKEESGNRILTPEEFKAQGLSPRDWTLMKGASYGALEGMYVRTDLALKVEDSAEVARTFDQVLAMAESKPLETIGFWGRKGLEGWAKLAATIKSIQLVWNLGNMAFNFAGGGIILLSNGNLNPKQIARAFVTAKDLIQGAGGEGGKHTADTEKVVRAGITDSAFMGEIRAVELEQLRQLTLDSLRSPVERKASKLFSYGSRVKRSWKETYAMADVVWKIANFYSEEAQLTAQYKANGDKVSAEFIEREAARRTNVSNFSYKRVPSMFKIGEKAGLTYIMPYIYETFRAPVGSFLIGVEDIYNAKNANTPEARNLMLLNGSKRLVGSMLSIGIAQQMLYALAKELSDLDEDEEEWLETIKAFLPDYKEYSDYLPMGKRADGTPVLFEFSRLDPMGPATEFYKMMVSGAPPEDYLEAVNKLVIENPYGTSIIKAVLGTGSTNTRLENIHPALYETLKNSPLGMRGTKVVDSMMPSWYIRSQDPKNAPADGDILGKGLQWAGVALQPVNVPESMQFAVNQYTAETKDLKREVYDFLKSEFEPTDEDILRKFVELRDKEDKAFERIEKVFEGAVRLGYSPEMVAAKLKEDGISDNDIRHLANGGYRPEASNLLSLEGLERSWEEVVQDDSTLRPKKQKYLDNINRALRLAGEGRLPMGE